MNRARAIDEPPEVRWLGRRDYLATLEAMRAFTRERGDHGPDEIWLCEHPSIFTLGQGASPEHVIDPGPIPVVRSDRGGQVTYHGPGQAVVYVLLDLARRRLGVRRLVDLLEESVIRLLAAGGVASGRRAGAPGVYVAGRKIAALGLRVSHGRTYHGLALNVEMDLAPYRGINPCGYPALEVTRLVDLGIRLSTREAAERLADTLVGLLGESGR